ncbi:proline dehydrogenase family protein [Candidatus Halobonum tyrrellensis]|uniref:proline dehydrogenase n=1 Tax=Candidatus Halobonum tyrrellensis G22 TaxID=1324957 RepID=V4HEY9_9EURY|nr:proline dehydrogenase family protein [Candidatus Halobonum tyrrellensis]ESP89275.1 proline dehydrogenase [Candidatus Halobonum tyrrellensis G22]
MIPPIASRFVAGETPAAAFEHTRETNEEGVKVILNLLGEHYHDAADAAADTEVYERLVADIGGTDLDACVSVKPSQLGLDVSDATFVDNFRRVVEAGDEHGVFVWCDMEDADTTDVTLDAFEELAREHDGGVGQCVQANLRRTRSDLDRLADVPGKIRLVKGAYDEGEAVAYTDKTDVNEAYREDLEFLFKERDAGIAVGSHDPKMISYAKELHDQHESEFEVQMLMGVRGEAQRRLAREGYEVWQYAPYGGKWLSYFYRRVRERRENLTFALRAAAGV